MIPIKQRYCAKHAPLHEYVDTRSKQTKRIDNRQYNLYCRDQEANEFYHSKQWTKVRQYVCNRDMYMSAISNKVINDKDLIVDHIIPMRLCDDPLNTNNLWCLSRAEHNVKTKLEQSMDDNQLKHIKNEWWNKVLKEKFGFL